MRFTFDKHNFYVTIAAIWKYAKNTNINKYHTNLK